MNFNNNNVNPSNTNSRANGCPVRCVQELVRDVPSSYSITREQLLLDLFRAYKNARKHKRRQPYQIRFEMNLEAELIRLRDDLYKHIYQPSNCMCFIVFEPKQREIFASRFRDRVVHHLYFDYVSPLFERIFIHDSFSCRAGRGTHFGINELDRHIRSASDNYCKPCYAMKMDIEGYFMHIDRTRLLEIVIKMLYHMRNHRAVSGGERWRDRLDYSLLYFMSERIIMNDPTKNVFVKGSLNDWKGLPDSKSLFRTPKGCGLPIGNLTSQLFSNIYLDRLDQFVKRNLHCRYYGRYVDDFYVVTNSKEELRSMVNPINDFMREELGLKLHPKKTIVYNAMYGLPFLGTYLKPYRHYVDNKCWHRMSRKLAVMQVTAPDKTLASINSYLGVLKHTRSYKKRYPLLMNRNDLPHIGFFAGHLAKFSLFKDKPATV